MGATAQGVGTYAGNLSNFKLAPGFFNSNKAIITVPIDEQVGDAALGVAGESSATATLKSLAGWIVPGRGEPCVGSLAVQEDAEPLLQVGYCAGVGVFGVFRASIINNARVRGAGRVGGQMGAAGVRRPEIMLSKRS